MVLIQLSQSRTRASGSMRGPNWFIWLLRFVWFVWFNQINEANQLRKTIVRGGVHVQSIIWCREEHPVAGTQSSKNYVIIGQRPRRLQPRFHDDIEPWLPLYKTRWPFLDRAQKELVEGLDATVRTGLVRTGEADPCLMYHR